MSTIVESLKRSRSARSILQRSIEDIENGLWVCSSWTERSSGPKPMGCALGLVAINTGVRETARIRQDNYGTSAVITSPTTASDLGKPWPAPALKAAQALAATIKAPKKARAEYDDSYAEESIVENIVIDYNDNNLTPARALGWFRRALASLDA